MDIYALGTLLASKSCCVFSQLLVSYAFDDGDWLRQLLVPQAVADVSWRRLSRIILSNILYSRKMMYESKNKKKSNTKKEQKTYRVSKRGSPSKVSSVIVENWLK